MISRVKPFLQFAAVLSIFSAVVFLTTVLNTYLTRRFVVFGWAEVAVIVGIIWRSKRKQFRQIRELRVQVAERISMVDEVRAAVYADTRNIVNRSRLHRPPAWNLHRVARWWFSHRTFRVVLEPVLSDMQHEFYEALAEQRPIKARWVQLRGYWTFWTHVTLQVPVSLTRLLVTLWRIGR